MRTWAFTLCFLLLAPIASAEQLGNAQTLEAPIQSSNLDCMNCDQPYRIVGEGGWYVPHQRHTTGNTQLDRALEICDKHRVPNNAIAATNPPTLDPAWEASWSSCSKVEQKWENSEAAKEEAARVVQEKKDHELVDSVAKDP